MTRSTPVDEITAPSNTQDPPTTTIITTSETQPSTTPPDAAYSAFSQRTRRFIAAFTTLGMILCSISTQIYYPVMPLLVTKYEMTPTLINLSITIYMIIQGITPAIIGSSADVYGRRPAWIISLLIYTGANIGLACQTSYTNLLIFRVLQSVGCSVSTTLGFAVVADIAPRSARGKYMGLIVAGTMVPIALGATLGGVLAKFLGWRSVFWFLVIGPGSYLLLYVVLMPETARPVVGAGRYPPSEWWRKSIVQQVFPGDENPHRCTDETQPTASVSVVNPLKVLTILRCKPAFIAAMSLGVVYFAMIAVLTSMATRFGEIYRLDSFQIGLCYLPFGLAGSLSILLNSKLIDLNFHRVQQKTALHRDDPSFPIKRVRLQIALPWMLLAVLTMTPYGWLIQQDLPLAAPLAFQGGFGLTVTPLTSIFTILVVDLFPGHAAVASAACNLTRPWMGAVAAAVVDYMVRDMGWGWCFVLIGGVVGVLTVLVGYLAYFDSPGSGCGSGSGSGSGSEKVPR